VSQYGKYGKQAMNLNLLDRCVVCMEYRPKAEASTNDTVQFKGEQHGTSNLWQLSILWNAR